MTTTTMHFGPEWMRTKQAPSRPNPSPPLTSPAPPGASSYSALVAPASQPPPEKRDLAHPFRYAKEDIIRIYKEGGGKGGLGLEVERWEGIVREVGSDPVSLKEMGEAERKIFAGPLNSEMRRRPSTDYLSLNTAALGERPKLNHATSGASSPMRERLGGFMGRRRDSTDQAPLSLPRKLSLSSLQGPLASPREALPSPRTRLGGAGGFDGVLSDAWSSRRRTSEGGLLKGNARAGDTSDSQNDPKTEGIKEEEEEPGAHGQPNGDTRPEQSLKTDPPLATPISTHDDQTHAQPDAVDSRMAGLSLNTRVQRSSATPSLVSTPVDMASTGPPPGLIDINAVEWSYLDPQGQVQGPFPAATMQKWYDDGYFTPNLLMKRTHIDVEWASVGELLQRVGNTRIFLTPLNATLPPGLTRRESLLDGHMPDGTFGSPFQPVPSRSLLDNYLHNGSVAPESPSSAFNTGRFSNGSPDPSILGGRLAGHFFNEPAVSSRLVGIPGMQGSVHGVDPQRRGTYEEGVDTFSTSRSPYTNFAPGRTNSIDALGFNGMDGAATSSDNSISPFASGSSSNTAKPHYINKAGLNNLRESQSSPLSNGHHPAAPSFGSSEYGASNFINSREGSRLLNRDVFNDRPEASPNQTGQYMNGAGLSYQPNGQAFSVPQTLPYTPQHDTPSVHSLSSVPERQGLAAQVTQQRNSQQPMISSPGGIQSAWPPQEITTRRPGPFDPDYPTNLNTITHRTTAPSQPAQQPMPPSTIVINDQSHQLPWFSASQGAVNGGWGPDPNSLTTANLGQHNRQHERELKQQLEHPDLPVATSGSPAVVEANTVTQEHTSQAAVVIEAPVATTTEVPPNNQKRRKASVPSLASPQVQSVKPSTSSNPTVPKPPSPVTASPAEIKPAWAVEEDNKAKPAGAALGLREIQELETKRMEVRRAAERERERAARAASGITPSTDEVQTLSWGLPTSQVGARATPAAKETSILSPGGSTAASSTPVWTTAPKVPAVKKTMKEIQEEEEKRKKVAKEKETMAAAAKRAYAESTNKSTPIPQSGGAWTTVGSTGKANTIVATPPPRPALAATASTKVVAISSPTSAFAAASLVVRTPNTATPSRPPTTTTFAKSTLKVDETPAPSSLDFAKWLSDSLKGLNNSVNMEEITSMLLSFPLDADTSTMEIISDLIYANSTTLDGRRFAQEFVSRRRADGKGSPAAGKPVSIADVVKTQPKPVGNEWGGFKVVNKKKKSARA